MNTSSLTWIDGSSFYDETAGSLLPEYFGSNEPASDKPIILTGGLVGVGPHPVIDHILRLFFGIAIFILQLAD